MQYPGKTSDAVRVGATLIALAGLGLIGYAVWFIVQDVTALIEIGLSPAEVGKTKEQIWAFSPGVYYYLSHVQAALGAFIAATGLAIAFMAWYGVRRGVSWAWWGSIITTVLWAVVSLPFHYIYGFGTFTHLGPAYIDMALVAIGGYLARPRR